MIVLGLETSTAACGAALASDEGWCVEKVLVEAHIHSEQLLRLVSNVLSEATLSLDALDAVAVSIGPGSFTGLRISVSSAKGLCVALEKPMVTVPTFDAIAATAASHMADHDRLLIAVDAKRNDYYTAIYSSGKSGFVIEQAVRVLNESGVQELLQQIPNALVVTDQVERFRQLGSGTVLPLSEYCRASSVATIGLKKVRAKEFADPTSTEPMYLKEFVVLTQSTSPHT
jgi:tRNA threonylcarbamoyladenosine biosynthesis protein TsaB